MTHVEMLEKVYKALAVVDANSSAARELNECAESIKAQMREAAAKSSGSLDAVKAADRLIASVDENHPELRYAWTDEQGRQCFCNGFMMFRLTKPLDLKERPADLKEPDGMNKLMDGFMTATRGEKLNLPTISELKAYIAENRAQWKAKTSPAERRAKPFSATVNFGPKLPAVDAEYLLTVLKIMGEDAEAWCPMKNGKPVLVTAIPITSPMGEAALLPIRKLDEPEEKLTDEQIEKLERLERNRKYDRDIMNRAQREIDLFVSDLRRHTGDNAPEVDWDELKRISEWRAKLEEVKQNMAEYDRKEQEIRGAA